jgi:T-complex protein 1 subunit theta
MAQFPLLGKGSDQYGVRMFSEVPEIVPGTVADNSRLRLADFMAKRWAARSKAVGKTRSGLR